MRALGEMRGNLWIGSHWWLGDYEKLRGNLMCLVIFVWGVLAVLAWLAWRDSWFAWCYLLDQS